MGQGRENVKKYLIENQDLLKKINKQVREALGLIKKPETPAEAPKAAEEREAPENQQAVAN